MKDVFVSVVVASYNYERYLKETLDSILGQSYDNFELIVFDDGSKDGSVAIIEEYVKKDSRVKFYHHKNFKNKGLAEAIRFALSKAKGEWVAFCESDDYWHKDYLQRKVNCIKNDPSVTWIVSNVDMFGEKCDLQKKKMLAKEFKRLRRYGKKKNAFVDLYHKNLVPTFSSVMVRKDVLESCDFNTPVPMWIDWWLWKQISFVHPMIFIDENLTHWRLHEDSYNTNKDKRSKPDYKGMIKQGTKLLKEKHGKEYSKRIRGLFFTFAFRKIRRKLKLFSNKDGYLRIKLLGIDIFKIKYGKNA